MSAYVLHSVGCFKAKRQWLICEQYGKTFAKNIIYMEFQVQTPEIILKNADVQLLG